MKWVVINLGVNSAVLAAKLRWIRGRWQRESRRERRHGVTGTDQFQPGAERGPF